MDLVILFDWLHQREHGRRAAGYRVQQRDMFLRLALMWGTAAQQCRKEASTEAQAN